MPRYGPVEYVAAEAFFAHPSREHTVPRRSISGSNTPRNFNKLWCEALNARPRPDYFAMIHADLGAEPWWVDTLVGELERTHASVVSAVIAIKDCRGLTSMVCEGAAGPRRLTLREVHALPETFDVGTLRTVGYACDTLLVSTGLFVCDFRQPWVDRVAFRFDDAISRQGDVFAAVGSTEDWAFSRQVAAAGGRVCATRKVATLHVGPCDYPSAQPWGTWATDLNAGDHGS